MTARKTDLEAALDHRYRDLEGNLLINVTAASGLIDDGKSIGMAYGAAKIAKEGGDFRSEWDAKRDTGTRVHQHLEAWLRGDDIEVTDEDKGHVDALEKFLVDNEPEPLLSEAIVLSKLGFGGRLDQVYLLDGLVTLLDLKTGAMRVAEHRLQTSAYWGADGQAVYDSQGSLTGLKPLPDIERAGCLYTRPDGSYDLRFWLPDREAFHSTFEVFTGLLRTVQWLRSAEIKAMVKEAKS